ncbi:MAG: hypothetical protein J7K29_03575 [Candidatus Cloacimonetes bacterium]|nr:hypothetical protein [Candidatus Cloacimonadota bacterium]
MKFIKFSILVLIFIVLTACLPAAKTTITEKPKNLTLDDQMNKLTGQIISSFKESKIRKIAVIEFADLNGNVTNFGSFIAEELITRIFMTNKFEVVERNLLNKVLAEQKLGITGFIDEESAISIGRLLGVEAIVTGSITDLVNDVKLNARLISTETGSIFSVASVSIQKDETIRKLMGEGMQKNNSSLINESIPTKTQEPQTNLLQTQIKHGIKFELESCFYTGEFLSIIFNMTNESTDKQISLLDRSTKMYVRFIDDQGREYRSPNIKLGTHRNGWNGIQDITVVEGVGTQLIYKFSNVKIKPNIVKRLDILLQIPELNNCFEVTYRNIEVTE